ncbi:hypothetical protein Dimus_017307 [Dionaea muscipula]
MIGDGGQAHIEENEEVHGFYGHIDDGEAAIQQESKIATAKTVLTAVGSVAATVVLARSLARDLIPEEIQDFFYSGTRSFLSRYSSEFTMIIEEYAGLESNKLFEAAELYLGARNSPTTNRLKVSKGRTRPPSTSPSTATTRSPTSSTASPTSGP